MSYYLDQITDLTIDTTNRYAIVSAKCPKDCVQCYVGGRLAAWQRTRDGAVWFTLGMLTGTDVVYLLAVDLDDAETDYFEQAFSQAASVGNRIVAEMSVGSAYVPGDLWRVYLGDEGAAEADQLVAERKVFPSGERSGGWGTSWGRAWGLEDYGAGWGGVWGAAWGYGTTRLRYISDPLPPGDYPAKIAVVDRAGNESTESSDTITLDTYARPGTSLTVESTNYTWTVSEDI